MKLNNLLSDINSKENPATTFNDVVDVLYKLEFETFTVNESYIEIECYKLKYTNSEWIVDFS